MDICSWVRLGLCVRVVIAVPSKSRETLGTYGCWNGVQTRLLCRFCRVDVRW